MKCFFHFYITTLRQIKLARKKKESGLSLGAPRSLHERKHLHTTADPENCEGFCGDFAGETQLWCSFDFNVLLEWLRKPCVRSLDPSAQVQL